MMDEFRMSSSAVSLQGSGFEANPYEPITQSHPHIAVPHSKTSAKKVANKNKRLLKVLGKKTTTTTTDMSQAV